MIDFKEMSLEELESLRAAIFEEIARRRGEQYVLYAHRCKDAPRYHLMRHKHWAKLVHRIDTRKVNVYAIDGEFLAVEKEHMVLVGSTIVEVCGDDIVAYKMTANGAEVIARAKTNAMYQFIKDVANAL